MWQRREQQVFHKIITIGILGLILSVLSVFCNQVKKERGVQVKYNPIDDKVKTKSNHGSFDSAYYDTACSRDSIWTLKKILRSWGDSDSIVDRKAILKFCNGKLIFQVENEEEINKRYLLIEEPIGNSLGHYTLNVQSMSFHSINFYKDSILIFGNGDDMNVYLFTKE